MTTLGTGQECPGRLFACIGSYRLLPPCSSDYIDEVFPGGSYWPEDPYRKAVARLFVNDFGNDVS